MKRWKLTAKVLIVEEAEGETKAEAFVKAMNDLKAAMEDATGPRAKVVITSASIVEEK